MNVSASSTAAAQSIQYAISNAGAINPAGEMCVRLNKVSLNYG